LLDSDPVGNAVTWDRVFQQPNYEVFAEGKPPRGVLALQRPRRSSGPGFIALHARDVAAAGSLTSVLPPGFTIIHLTEEFSLPLLEAKATEFHPKPAWLFRLDPDDAVEVPDKRSVRSIRTGRDRSRALWEPEWPAEGYVRRRIEAGPTAAVYDDGRPVAWALTHMVTDRVGIVGMVHVLEAYRRKGLARAVVAAISHDLIRAGKTPALHAYVDNVASLSLFPTLGFRRVRRQVWGDAVFR